MKVLKEFKSYRVTEMEPLELTLLSEEEYEASKACIPQFGDFWWLRSPEASNHNYALVVSAYGYQLDDCVDCIYSVRPAFKFTSPTLLVTDRFKLGDRWWTVITDGIALCDTAFCHMAFRSDWKEPNANDYTHSDIKKYLDQQFEWMKQGQNA